MAVFFKSEINRRSSNEDSFCDIQFLVNHEAAVHAMTVADGMGGLTGGKYYSRKAVESFNEKLLKLLMGEDFAGSSLNEQTESLTRFLEGVFQEINQELYTRGLNAGIKGGTTLSVVIRFWHCVIIANCGDSPVYYMKDGKLYLASQIQNAAWKMVEEGRIEEGSLQYYQNKARLLEYLGKREPVKPALQVIRDKEMDSLLLGTDGAFGDLTRGQIQKLLQDYGGQQTFLSQLFEAAKAGGEEDNQTAIYYISEFRQGRSQASRISESRRERSSGSHISETLQEEKVILPEGESLRQEINYEERSIPGEYKKAGSRIAFLKNKLSSLKSSGGKNR